ncbi:anthranilate n-hydroxycinnamoyl/benzoyltransferase [Fusarium austroafricanum]|uniref:Anthranilate n-hydroxycinnamoyl/benzoyltransferase n=1 Tax=Fusarium austroafricanum TaxID=2364996 RepID=A0A8H4K8W5_9HYPO|nr:anthranilate n-hydroxycinnamoyl/benzoyltransferase [Fusarium austroafricanum]
MNSNAEIPLKVSDQRSSFGWTYSQLKNQGFPADAFVNESFDPGYQIPEGQGGIPVLEIHVRLIEGGLLLGIYGHHSVFDATGLNMIIKAFAQLTSHPTRALDNNQNLHLYADLPVAKDDETRTSSRSEFRLLLDKCIEYCLLPSPTGPTQFRIPVTDATLEKPGKTGRIFAIDNQQLRDLKLGIQRAVSIGPQNRPPSTFTCLAALVWAHTTKARLSSSGYLSSPSSIETASMKDARLLISVDWRHRAFTNVMGSSSGNAIALSIASVNTANVMAAYNADQNVAYSALSTLVQAIEDAVRSVDDDFVALRTALIRESPDPRLIGVDINPEDPYDFYFNTWRHFGTSTLWRLPGLGKNGCEDDVAPDALRRAQPAYSVGTGLLFPAGSDPDKFEVMIGLEMEAMVGLCADPSWQRWLK